MAVDLRTVGEFHISRSTGWQVTSPSVRIATAAGALVEVVPRRGSDGSWALCLPADDLRIRAEALHPDALVFRLAALADPGPFTLGFAPWSVEDVFGAATTTQPGWVGGAQRGLRRADSRKPNADDHGGEGCGG